LVRQRTALANALRAHLAEFGVTAPRGLRNVAPLIAITDPWVKGLRRRRPSLVVAVAVANKTARIAWAVMRREESYRPRAAAA
jgi:transposase